jgi:hypothetical protein
MSKYYSTICLLSALISTAIAQSENERISSIELHPTYIDTLNENTLVIHKRYATIYFKQSDIQEYVKHQDKFGLPLVEKFIITNSILQAKKNRIDFKDWFAEYTEQEKLYLKLLDYNGIDHMAMPELWFIGYNLIKEGKFMIFENNIRETVYNGLKMINQNSEFGINSVQFQLPTGLQFWQELFLIGD